MTNPFKVFPPADDLPGCPFCGSQPELQTMATGTGEFLHFFACSNPPCGVVFNKGDLTVAGALERWATRWQPQSR